MTRKEFDALRPGNHILNGEKWHTQYRKPGPGNDKLNQQWGIKPILCNNTCRYWKFPHLETACVLSSVFAVHKGAPCYEYKKGG